MVKLILNILFVCVFSLRSGGQSLNIDKDLILKKNCNYKDTYYDETKGNSSLIMTNHGKSFLKKINPITITLRLLMYTYQNGVSQQLISSCQFELTCSNFSKESIKEYGFIKGVFLTADRLMRDNMYGLSQYSYIYFNENGHAQDNVKDFRMK